MSTPYYNAEAGTTPVVVQGHAVTTNNTPAVYNSSFSTALNVESGTEWQKGEKQPSACRDGIWAILFYVHLGLIAFASVSFIPQMAADVAEGYAGGAQRQLSVSMPRMLQNDNGDEDIEIDLNAIMTILAFCGIGGIFISSLAMLVMIQFAETLIKIALIFNLVVSGALALLSLAAGSAGSAIMFTIGFLFSAYYCYIVWSKIPFAASNLVTATTAVRANMGLAFFAFTNLVVTFLWSLWWAATFVSANYVLGQCDADGNCEQEINGGLVFLFLVSYFWTAQVVKNVVHTTVAGTVGTFWFTPEEARGCCSAGVRDSYMRSITTSFGSICLGSLIVAILQALKEIVHSIREQNDSILVCLAECILALIRDLVEYFNQWAFVYVGLYGYSFMEAGKNVINLFKARGWTSIIADMLVDTALLMVSVGVGILTGLVGLIVASVFQMGDILMAGGFVAGFVVGFVMCSTLFSIVSSAVNATIVLFAEAPAELQANHPVLAAQMLDAWRTAYPNEFRY